MTEIGKILEGMQNRITLKAGPQLTRCKERSSTNRLSHPLIGSRLFIECRLRSLSKLNPKHVSTEESKGMKGHEPTD